MRWNFGPSKKNPHFQTANGSYAYICQFIPNNFRSGFIWWGLPTIDLTCFLELIESMINDIRKIHENNNEINALWFGSFDFLSGPASFVAVGQEALISDTQTERKGRYNLVYIYTWGLSKIGYIRKNSIWTMAKFELRGVMHFLFFFFFFFKKGCFRLAIQDCTKVNPTCISFFVMNFHLNMIYMYIYIHTVFCWGVGRTKIEGFKARPLRLELSPLQRVSSDSYRQSIYNKAEYVFLKILKNFLI